MWIPCFEVVVVDPVVAFAVAREGDGGVVGEKQTPPMTPLIATQ